MSVFPKEIYQAPRSWAERAYPNLIYFNEVDRGCHFAAWQEPALFTAELRAAFRSLRYAHSGGAVLRAIRTTSRAGNPRLECKRQEASS